MRKRSKYKPRAVAAFRLIDQLIALPDAASSPASRDAQLTAIREAFHGLRFDAAPRREDWATCSECVNLLETMLELNDIADEEGCIARASEELKAAAKRARAGQSLRLSGVGIEAMEHALIGYETAIEALPERRLIEVHRRMEIRMQAIVAGRAPAPGGKVVSL